MPIREDPRQQITLQAEVRRQQAQKIVQEIVQLRKEVEKLSTRIQDCANDLRTKSRRFEDGSKYVIFSNAYLRFSGVIFQGLRRTVVFDRVLKEDDERDETRSRLEDQQQKQRVRDHGRLVNRLQLFSEDAMTELYGEILGMEEPHA